MVCDDHLLQFVRDDQVSAWGGFSLVGAGLEVDVQGTFLQNALVTDVLNRVYFRVCSAILLMPSLPHDIPVMDDHTSHQRIGTYIP